MPRRVTTRLVLPGFACCYHITQRCQERRYLLQHAKDRRKYLKRLWETSRRYPVSVLNYMITSNHVHLLLWSESPRHVSAAMQYLSGAAAQDYNRRLGREGAFWRGRYRPTLVEDGHHLTRCFFYVELNMVRAQVVQHPSEWYGGAFAEHSGVRERYRIIDRPRLLTCLECADGAEFSDWYVRTLNEECQTRYRVREALWSEAAAVGSRQWVEGIAGRMPRGWYELEPASTASGGIADAAGTYVLRISDRRREGLLGSLRP